MKTGYLREGLRRAEAAGQHDRIKSVGSGLEIGKATLRSDDNRSAAFNRRGGGHSSDCHIDLKMKKSTYLGSTKDTHCAAELYLFHAIDGENESLLLRCLRGHVLRESGVGSSEGKRGAKKLLGGGLQKPTKSLHHSDLFSLHRKSRRVIFCLGPGKEWDIERIGWLYSQKSGKNPVEKDNGGSFGGGGGRGYHQLSTFNITTHKRRVHLHHLLPIQPIVFRRAMIERGRGRERAGRTDVRVVGGVLRLLLVDQVPSSSSTEALGTEAAASTTTSTTPSSSSSIASIGSTNRRQACTLSAALQDVDVTRTATTTTSPPSSSSITTTTPTAPGVVSPSRTTTTATSSSSSSSSSSSFTGGTATAVRLGSVDQVTTALHVWRSIKIES
ncbi:hypothetical protein TYRP_002519 [Tyrophagus putrescentiae]|nr:hypothetical protein TYRP_002519 [Tyrophagus putrescentiae]